MVKKIYISGKITGLDTRVAKELFDLGSSSVKALGHHPVNPMEIHPEKDGWEWHHYMKADIKLLCDCDAIYMLENWQDSKGAKVEHDLARELNMEIIYHKS